MRPCQQVSQVWPGQGFLGSTPGFGRMCLCLQFLYLIFPDLISLFLPLKCINILVFSLPSFSSSLLTHSHSPELSCPCPPFLHCPFGTWTHSTCSNSTHLPTPSSYSSPYLPEQIPSRHLVRISALWSANCNVPPELSPWSQMTSGFSSQRSPPLLSSPLSTPFLVVVSAPWVHQQALLGRFVSTVFMISPCGGRVVAQPARRELLWHCGTGSAMRERSEL